jgi:hypothetical protein
MHIADFDWASSALMGSLAAASAWPSAAYSADAAVSGRGHLFLRRWGQQPGILMKPATWHPCEAADRLPVQENQYGVRPQPSFIAVDRLEHKATAFAMPAVTVDGNDVLAVYETARQVVSQAARRSSPTFVVAPDLSDRRPYRWATHSATARRKRQLWKSARRDSDRFGRRLIASSASAKRDLEAQRQRAREDIDDAIAFGKASPGPICRR